MRALWTEESVDFEGEYYRSCVGANIYDRPGEAACPCYIAAGGPLVAKYAGRAGDGFICTSGKGMDLYTEKLLPAVAEGAEPRRSATPTQVDKMIEIKISYDRDPAAGAGEHLVLGAAVAHAGAEAPASLGQSRWSGRGRAADRAGRQALDRRRPTPTRPSRMIKPYVDAGSTTSWCTAPATTRSASSPSSRRGRCRGLGA